jgi:hypothetical protein
MIRKIKFQDEIYWLATSEFCDYNISPLNHYDEQGNLTANSFNDISFAIVEGKEINRFGEKIGTFPNDIEYLD